MCESLGLKKGDEGRIKFVSPHLGSEGKMDLN
jgi:hypothetical protein